MENQLSQARAPIFEALRAFSKERVVPFDVPGHKHGKGNPELTEFLGQATMDADVNSMKPLDNLCHPVSVIHDAEVLAAQAFGAAHAFFMVSGTTGSVQAMILSVCKRGDKIIMPRNVHRSAINALVLCGAVPVYVNPGVDPQLGIALGKLSEEDPTFTVKTDEDSGQTVISGMGELHLEIIVDRLKREFGVEISQGAPQVNYKESLKSKVQHREVFKKQTGGRGKFADIIFEIGPSEEGKVGLQFEDVVKGGNIPKEYIPAIQKGFESSMTNGPLAGFPLDSMKVTVIDGSFHPVDSDALSFEICARNGFREAARKASPVILEPIMSVEVVTPEENMGDIIGDLNKRRGQINGMESKGTARVVNAKVPLSEMFGYVTVLRTISSGRATSSMEFSHFDEVPAGLAKEIIEKSSGKKGSVE